MLGIIAKSFQFLNEMFLRIYTTMVHPILEYRNQIWGPRFKLDQIIMEKVQRRTTRLLKSIQHHTYQDHLTDLKLPSLEYRCLRGNVMFMYQNFQVINIDSSLLFTFSSTSSTRGHNYKLYEPFAHAITFLEYKESTFGIIYHMILLMLLLYLFFKNKLAEHWKDMLYTHNS